MREILFRGKRIDNGGWFYGYLYITHNGEFEIGRYDEYVNIERITKVVDKKTVGQYTGLTDKNGTKIFEGDIVSYTTGKGEVVYRDDYCCFMLKEEEEYFEWIENVKHDCEVIGNIHDNPELIGESDA